MTPLNSRELIKAIKIDLETGLVPFVKGSPGIGKTAMISGIAEEAKLFLIVVHGSMLEPTDVNGFPDVGGKYAVFKTFEMFPTEDTPIPAGYNGWLLFIDEINSASTETQAALYSLILNKKAGQAKLHPMCFIAAAGNLKTDNAIVNTQSSAMTSRMVNYEMKFEPTVFLEDVVIQYDWHSYVAAYLEWKPEMIHRFDPAKAEDPYACPRTWDMLQQRITTQEDYVWFDDKGIQRTGFDYLAAHNRASAEGLIGQEIGREFITFIRTLGRIPATADVIKDPLGTPIPDTRGLVFATVIQLRKDADANNLDDIYAFVERLDPELRVSFIRGVMHDPSKQIPRSHPTIIHAQKTLRKRATP